MRRSTVVPVVLIPFLLVLALLAVQSAVAAPPPSPKPDLVITDFGLTSWGLCAPGQTVFTFSATVKNQGAASWSGVEPVLLVRDLHPGVMDAWGTGIGIDPPLRPGESKALQVQIKYYAGNPSHMGRACSHPFQAVVNPNHVVQESNFDNNAGPGPALWRGGVKVIMVCPAACQK